MTNEKITFRETAQLTPSGDNIKFAKIRYVIDKNEKDRYYLPLTYAINSQ
jgi:hypothetical protein